MTLQVKLYQVLSSFSDALDSTSLNAAQDVANVLPENVKGATVVVSVLPILIVYPMLQKYFIKGVAIGAVKG